jgi:hypothetical protein
VVQRDQEHMPLLLEREQAHAHEGSRLQVERQLGFLCRDAGPLRLALGER